MRSSTSFMAIALLQVPSALAANIVSTITLTGSAAVPTVTSTTFIDDKTFKNDMLVAHNFYRAQHGAAALVWNDTSAKYAADWAKGCVFEHSVSCTSHSLSLTLKEYPTSISHATLPNSAFPSPHKTNNPNPGRTNRRKSRSRCLKRHNLNQCLGPRTNILQLEQTRLPRSNRTLHATRLEKHHDCRMRPNQLSRKK